MDSSYAHRLHARPDKLEFFVTATPVSKVITRPQGLALNFASSLMARPPRLKCEKV